MTAQPSEGAQIISGLLGRMLENDTNVVVTATTQLQQILRKPESMVALLEILHTSESETMRQLSAVMMRKKITKHWANLPENIRTSIQSTLLQHVAFEPSSLVRRSVAEVVGSIAKITLPVGLWNELLPFLHQCSQSSNPEHKEAALKLFGIITDTILSDPRNKHFKPAIFQIIGEALSNQANTLIVKLTAMQAIGNLVHWLDSEKDITDFRDGILPHILSVLQHCITQSLVDPLVDAFSCFDDLLELPFKAVATCIPPIVQIALQVAANKDIEFPIRQIAFTFIEWVARFKPGFIKKRNLLPSIFTVLFRMCAEPEEEKDDNEDDEDETSVTPHQYAAEMIDLMSEALPSRLVYSTATPFIAEFLQSPDLNQKKAAIAAITVLAENCAESMKEHLQELLSTILGYFENPNKMIKESACVAMGQLSEHLIPEILEYHSQIIPCVFKSMVDPDPVIQQKGCNVFEVFASNLGGKIIPYMPQLMERLLNIVVSGTLDVKEIALGCIASIVESAKKDFAPYMATTLSVLKPLSTLTGEKDLLIRARAMECFGSIAKVAGKESFSPYVIETMTSAVQGLQIESAFVFDVREMTFGFFGNISEVLGQDFAPFLETVMPLVFAMVESNELTPGKDDAREAEEKAIEDDDDEDEDENLDDGDDSDEKLHIAFFQAKAAACRCVGTIAKEAKTAFLPYLEKSVKILLENSNYPFSEVRASVVYAFTFLLDVAKAAFVIPQGLHESTKAIIDVLMNMIFAAIDTDRSLLVNETALDGISHTCILFGEAAVTPYFEEITRRLAMLLQRKAICQRSASTAENDEEEEREEIDEDVPSEDREIDLFETIGEVILELTKVYGQRIGPFFMSVVIHFGKLMRMDNAHDYRALGIAVIVEVVRIAKLDPTPFLQGAMALVLQGLKDKDAMVRHNASFCAGILLTNSGANGLSYHIQTAQALAPFLQLPNGIEADVKDNAIGAIARLLLIQGTPLPLEQVLPTWLSALPLQTDKEEYIPVFEVFAVLLQQNIEKLGANIIPILNSVAHAVAWNVSATPEVDIAIAKIGSVLKNILSQQSNQLHQTILSLPQQSQISLSKLLS